MNDHRGEAALTRRRFLGTGAAAGAGALLGAAPGAEARRRRHRKLKASRPRGADVIVVGAGFAGLTAARELVNNGKSVLVVEARDRVGGRVWNHDLGGGDVSERGGTFVGPTQDHILALAKAYGVDTFDTYNTGDNVYIRDGNRQTYSDTGPTGTAPPDAPMLADLATVVTRLDDMSTHVPVDAPWQSDSAPDWDGQTLETWIKANSVNPDFMKLVRAATRPIFGAEPRELSLLFTLFYIASSGNEDNPGTFERNFNTRDGAQMWRLAGGSQTVAFRIAEQELKRRILLNRPVRRIVQDSAGVRVICDGLELRGMRVIVAVPPALAGRIDYDPLLPFQRDQLTQRLGQGALTKVAAVYDKPFWRDKGLNGTSVSTDGLVSATFDDSPNRANPPGVVFGFVGGDKCRAYAQLSDGDRRDKVLREFAALFGDEALRPTAFFDTLWAAEQWSRGCPVGICPPGLLLAYGDQLRAPQGRIHWAGTETSNYWNGYMDGAVRSGERAAREALDEL
ncbi:MAG TPA: flavin monoamine oxidase family protein [Solirubrobacteraceae bacterium]